MNENIFDENGNGEFPNRNDWKKYKIWVIDGIRRLRVEVDALKKRIDDVVMVKLNAIETDITKLQMKSGIWGLIAGLLGVTIALLIKWGVGL